jgi:hypothetical protein
MKKNSIEIHNLLNNKAQGESRNEYQERKAQETSEFDFEHRVDALYDEKIAPVKAQTVSELRAVGCSDQAIEKLFAADPDSLQYCLQFSSAEKKAAVLKSMYAFHKATDSIYFTARKDAR